MKRKISEQFEKISLLFYEKGKMNFTNEKKPIFFFRIKLSALDKNDVPFDVYHYFSKKQAKIPKIFSRFLQIMILS